METYDLFFSYRRAARGRAQPLLDALQQAGLRVWCDRTDLPDLAPVTEAIRKGVAASKTLIAFCSLDYFASRPCQQEFIAGWLAAHQRGARPYERILVINPETGFSHLPRIFAEQQSLGWAQDPAGLAALAAKIRSHVDSLEGLLGEVEPGVRPRYFGMAAVEARRFVGRVREMWELHDHLTAHLMGITTGQFGPSVTQVRGLGGSGKSLLAREYAIRFGPAYPGGVFWINASGDSDPGEVVYAPDPRTLRLDQIRSLGPYVDAKLDGLQPDEVEPEFWKAIESRGQACLWIVDDLPAGLTMDAVTEEWAARSVVASTLITTRSAEYGAIGRSLDLGAIAPAEALQLLSSQAAPRGKPEEDAAAQIVAELGYHPLAIDVAGAVLGRGTISFADFRDALRSSNKDAAELGVLLRPALPTGHHPSIAFTLLKSIELLGEEGLDFLCLACGLAADEIPISLVKAVFAKAGLPDEFGERTLLAVDQADALCLCSAVGDARTVHTLVSRTVRFHTRMNRRVAELRFAAAQALSETLLALSDLRRRNEVARELIHARHILSLDIQPIEVLDVGMQVASHDYDLGNYRSALSLQERVSESRSMRLGPEHPGTLAAQSALARTMFANGDRVRARKLQQEVLYACRRLGNENRLTLGAMNDLALTILHEGDLAGARALLEEVLQARGKSLGRDDAFALTAMSNLAGTLIAQGDLPGARKLQEEVLAARLQWLGPEHPLTLKASNNLALTLHQQGDLAAARQRHEEVLATRRTVLGDNHPDTIMSKDHVARVAQSQGNIVTALELHREVLESRTRLLRKDHPDTLKSMTHVAAALEASGDLVAAEELHKKTLQLSIQRLGEDHPEILNIQSHLASILAARQDLGGARALQEKVLDGTRHRLGAEHPNTAVAAWNLCQTLLALQDLDAARKVFLENLMFLQGRDPEKLPPALRQIQFLSGISSSAADA